MTSDERRPMQPSVYAGLSEAERRAILRSLERECRLALIDRLVAEIYDADARGAALTAIWRRHKLEQQRRALERFDRKGAKA